jgi:hypothetical protein
LFGSEKLLKNGTVALSFLFDKHGPIIIGSKDSSRGFQMNCANTFCFHVYLMLHACAVKFDVTGNLENFWELNKALLYCGRKNRSRQFVTLFFPT